jgi:hypothetical protein
LDGIFLDNVIRGKILFQDEKAKRDMFLEMSRTSGYLQGMAIALDPNDADKIDF